MYGWAGFKQKLWRKSILERNRYLSDTLFQRREGATVKKKHDFQGRANHEGQLYFTFPSAPIPLLEAWLHSVARHPQL